jgi:hypothetical protein
MYTPETHPSELDRTAACMQSQVNGTLKNILDPIKYAYSGHSLGGGGSLSAALQDRAASAILPLAPYHTRKDFSGISTPMLVVTCSQDTAANNSQHSDVFYASIQGPKAQIYVLGPHRCATSEGDTETVIRYARHVDGDVR